MKHMNFDWMGVEGRVKYPFDLPPDFQWPPEGAWSHKLIRAYHDVRCRRRCIHEVLLVTPVHLPKFKFPTYIYFSGPDSASDLQCDDTD